MEKKKIIKIISFLIITFLVFQLIPSMSVHADGFQRHNQNSKDFLSSTIANSDILCVTREYQKTSIQKIQLKNISKCISQVFGEDIYAINSAFQEVSFDFRRVIRQSIPHYFNGSKYKENHFAI